MFKPQLRFQKIMFLTVLILSVAFFLYAIGLCTDLYPLYISKAYDAVDGADFFDVVQVYNAQLVKFSIVMILVSIVPFIFSSNKRRKYYLDNLITNILQVALNIACSIFLIINTIKYKNLYLTTVDVEAYTEFCKDFDYFFSGSTIWFDLGFVFAILFVVATAAIVGNYIWKYMLVKNENKIINGEVTDNG